MEVGCLMREDFANFKKTSNIQLLAPDILTNFNQKLALIVLSIP